MPPLLERAPLPAAGLARDRLLELAELQAPNALVGRKPLAHEAEDLERHFTRRRRVAAQQAERLRDRQAHRVRARYHRGLGHEWMLDQRALYLERADAVVGALEHVVRA